MPLPVLRGVRQKVRSAFFKGDKSAQAIDASEANIKKAWLA
jgi:hypothetical protein